MLLNYFNTGLPESKFPKSHKKSKTLVPGNIYRKRYVKILITLHQNYNSYIIYGIHWNYNLYHKLIDRFEV